MCKEIEICLKIMDNDAKCIDIYRVCVKLTVELSEKTKECIRKWAAEHHITVEETPEWFWKHKKAWKKHILENPKLSVEKFHEIMAHKKQAKAMFMAKLQELFGPIITGCTLKDACIEKKIKKFNNSGDANIKHICDLKTCFKFKKIHLCYAKGIYHGNWPAGICEYKLHHKGFAVYHAIFMPGQGLKFEKVPAPEIFGAFAGEYHQPMLSPQPHTETSQGEDPLIVGGAAEDDIYEPKYYKYKLKYFDLKNKLSR